MTHNPSSHGPTRLLRLAALAAVVVSILAHAGASVAQETLACGVPVSRELRVGAVHAYRLRVPTGARAVVQSSDISATVGLLKLRVSSPSATDQTCSGVLEVAGRGDMLLEVSACSPGAGAGTYTVTFHVVTDGAGNCGRLLECGATPHGTGLEVLGEVDAFQIPLVEDEKATLQLNYLDVPGSPYVRLYDPHGRMIAERCSSTMLTAEFEAEETGIYTALVSACGPPVVRSYRASFHDFTCPSGPVITHLGVTNATSDPAKPIGFDPAGRPIYHQPVGQGLSLVVEARTGADGKRLGDTTAVSGGLPDLQAIVSRPLGNGDPTVCDVSLPNIGGVPATVPFAFSTTTEAVEIVNDLGCRFDDGQGNPRGRRSTLDACTRSDQNFGFAFVDRASTIQYCAQIASAWAFPLGDTLVGARVRDLSGALGEPRYMVVRVGSIEPVTPSATPTPTRSRTATATRTRTATATRTRTVSTPPVTATVTPTGPTVTPRCAGDCNGDGVVTVAEATRVINIALGQAAIAECPAADPSGDGRVAIAEVLVVVNNALGRCPGTRHRASE